MSSFQWTSGRISLSKSVDALAAATPPPAVNYRRYVGLDLGTNCGVAVCDVPVGRVAGQPCSLTFRMGQLDLSTSAYESGPLRLLRLQRYLEVLAPNFLAFEDVKYTPPAEQLRGKFNISAVVARVATASELLGSLKTVATTFCEQRGIPAMGVPISHIKRRATGKGNAGKQAVITAANTYFGVELPVADYEKAGSDNVADAAFCCLMGIESEVLE